MCLQWCLDFSCGIWHFPSWGCYPKHVDWTFLFIWSGAITHVIILKFFVVSYFNLQRTICEFFTQLSSYIIKSKLKKLSLLIYTSMFSCIFGEMAQNETKSKNYYPLRTNYDFHLLEKEGHIYYNSSHKSNFWEYWR